LFLICFGANASNGNENKQEQKNKEQQKSKELKVPFYSPMSEEFNGGINNEAEIASDSVTNEENETSFTSFSKLNYLFYFIYKYKYENRIKYENADSFITD